MVRWTVWHINLYNYMLVTNDKPFEKNDMMNLETCLNVDEKECVWESDLL